ncbi:intermembrane lipid transfer protein VPS13B-like isoform X3 [Myxocyprinus asiaticus]|uniref:intermembrane lipid transfer protein VPS13B-like isoform X3 n=1 Tax=Myxocyprinus asiaticus TaxID=70543 RepID=UPI002223D29E|nr:intermembrane lipid transfer protein VPS13B-like isoform X3 [Myxocyprinus asiaticus]
MLESYVSPLLMSYVNRYIKNLKPSDLQLSLWGGDVVLSKLDLRLDVLEQELKLPFTFLSGHIHELRIHVPWTKLSSEPVVITINTMECILKLRDGATDDNESCTSSSTNRSVSESSKNASKPRRLQQAPSDPDLPPGYVQSLIRRVVNNVNIVVNNLILKYVEDDIVLSVNITSAECYTVDDLWDRAFMDVISPELVLRKVINFSDCTVCLDKRNASGKIEFYQDPLLYKCSFRTRLHFTYDNINAKIPAVIKIHTLVESLKLSLTDQQLPMFIRLMALGVALYYGEMGVHREGEREENSSLRESLPDVMVEGSEASLAGQYFQGEDEDQGWVSWAWSFVPAIVSAEEEEGEGESGGESQDGGASRPQQQSHRDPVVSVGFYCTKASVTFKLTESCSESSYYSPQKVKSREVLCVEQEGITVEALMMGEPFFDCQVGVVGCRAVCLKGIMGVRDFEENMNRREEDAVFFRCGDTLSVKGMTYLTNSLFDYRSPENNGVRAEFILEANLHKETYTETAGVQRYGAFYMDYLYTMENSGSRVCTGPQEFSALHKDEPPLQESSVKRIVIGPLDVQLHSSAVHRILKMIACTLDHEYHPYCKPQQPDVVEECAGVTVEQVAALEEFIPTRQTSVTLMRATVTIPAAEYNILHLILPVILGHKVSTAQTSAPQFQLLRPLPALQLQFERVTFEHSVPMYEEEVTRTACSMNKPSDTLLHHCYTHCYLKVFEFAVGLTVIGSEGGFLPLIPIIPSFSTALYGKQLRLPAYWSRKCSVAVSECVFELPQVCVQVTRAQVQLLQCMFHSWTHSVGGGACSIISDTLINHAYKTTGVKSVCSAPVLEVCVQRVELKVCVRPALWCVSGTLGAVKVCARTPGEKDELVPLVQGPSDTTDLHTSRWLIGSRKPASLLSPDLLQISLQLPQQEQTLNPIETSSTHTSLISTLNRGAVLLVSVQGMAVNVDPVLFSWLLFHPQRTTSSNRQTQQVSMVMKKRREDEASVGSTPLTKPTSNPSDYTSSPVKTKTITESRPLSAPVKVFPSSEESHLSQEERMKNLITHTWNAVKRLTLQVELQSCCVFVPLDSLPSPSTLLCGDIPGTVRSWYHSQACMPGTLVLCLPQISVLSAGHRHMEPLQDIPFTVPRPVLEEGDAFPWTVCVSQLSVYSLLGQQRSLSVLDPVGCTSTLALTAPKLQPDTKQAFIMCLHVDLQPVHLKCSNPQVQLLYGLWSRWSQILSVFERMQSRGSHRQSSGFADSTAPPAGPSSPVQSSVGTVPPDTSTYSPSADLGSPTEGDSVHTEEPVVCESMTLEQKTCSFSGASGKFSVWMQWMLPKLTVKLFSTDHTSKINELCVIAELEDLSASVDVQDVYTKVKCKVGSFHIDHYKHSAAERSPRAGPCAGVVLSCTDKLNRRTVLLRPLGKSDTHSHFSFFPPTAAKALEVSHQQHGFLTVTYTQAVTRNVRHKLTARQERAAPAQRLCEEVADGSPQYLHEILLTTQPFDLVLSCPLLVTVARVFHITPPPHLRHPVRERHSAGQPMRGHALSSSSLPLIYVNTSVIRVFCPLEDAHSSTHPQLKDRKEDTVVLKIGSVSVAPQADNPLPRSVLRKDIYQRALNLGVLRDPGSEVEDRQYQIDLQSINMGTAHWDDLRPEREGSVGGAPSEVERSSQNPALEWNMASSIRRQQEKRVILSPIITDFSVRVTAAPAVIYRKPLVPEHTPTEEVVVCGHSLELNVTSSLELFLSVSQVQLLQQLLRANVGLTTTNKTPADVCGQQAPATAVSGSSSVESLCGSGAPCGQDSGFGSDSARLRIIQIERQSGTGHHRLARPSQQPTITKNLSFIPFDVFLTAGRISLMTYATTPTIKPPTDATLSPGKSMLDVPEGEAGNASEGSLSSLTADDLLNANTSSRPTGLLDGVCAPVRASARQALGVTVVRQPGRRGDKDCSLQPLMFLQLTQPSALINCHHRRQKLELSLFDLTLRGVATDYKSLDTGKSLPESLDYSVYWLQTVAGEADSRTGIPPPLLSVIIRDFLSGPELRVDISRPLRVSPTLAKIEQAKSFWRRIFPEGDPQPRTPAGSTHCHDGHAPLQTVLPFHKIALRTVQMVVAMEMESHTMRPSLTLSVSGMTGALTLKNAMKPADGFKEVCVSVQCEDVLLRTGLKDRTVVFVGPFSCSADLEAYWCRHSGSSAPNSPDPPRVLIDLKGGLLQVFWGQQQFNCLTEIQEHLKNYWSHMTRVEAESNEKPLSSKPPPTPRPAQSEHSSDDLRTGLFQYIQDSACQKLPSAHEVVFWKETDDSPGIMLWRYPEPRVITFLRITPVPFNTTDDPDISTADLGDVLQVPCSLEYWDELQRAFVPYREFSLSESSVCELTLPTLTPNTHQTDLVTSDLWRVVLNSNSDGGDESSDSESGSQVPCDQLVCPTALAACTRVDSCFAPWFVPSVGVSIRLVCVELRFCHNLDQHGTVPCQKLRPFLPDRKCPHDQEFAVVCVREPCVFVRQWSDVYQCCHELNFSSTLSTTLLEYRNLTQLNVIQPVSLQGNATHTCVLTHSQHTLHCNITLQPLQVTLGQYAIHTLDRALHAWRQNGVLDAEEVIFTHFIICNDTQEVLRFGQVDTDENILLHSNQSHQYSWRTHKSPQLLHICMEGWGNWRWAEPFSVDDVGTLLRTIQHKGQTASLIIRVKQLNGVQKQVIICGRQVFCSFLSQSIELRVVHHSSGQESQLMQRERVTRLEPDSKLPSFVLEDAELTDVCVRACGDEEWSQDVCLKHDDKTNNSCVVQVPCSNGSLLHVWCTLILLDTNTHLQQRAVVFSPLFIMWSHLPDPVLVHVEKRSLGHRDMQLIDGRGHQEVLLNVEADLTHHLTFQASEEEEVCDCAVPVSTAVIRQIINRAAPELKQNQNTILEHFYGEKTTSTPHWPYTSTHTHRCAVESVAQWDSPMQVRLSAWRSGLNTLLVELLPWAILVNHSHWDVWLFEAESIIAQIPAGKTIIPPNFKDAFQIGIYWPHTNTVHKSPAVRLVHEVSSPRWPEGGGADVLMLDEEGYIHTDITLGTLPGKLKLCQLCLSSSVTYGIQVLQIMDKTVLVNNTTNIIRYKAVIQQHTNTTADQVYEVSESSVFTLGPAGEAGDQVCCSVACWDVPCDGQSSDLDMTLSSKQLLLSCEGQSSQWSLPALVRPDLPRQSVSVSVEPDDKHPFNTRALVVTCQDHSGIMYVTVSEDLCPRMLIHNRCPMNLLLKENIRECVRSEVFCRLLPSLSSVHHELYYHISNFPECKQKETLPTLLLRAVPDTPTSPTDTPTDLMTTPTALSWTDAIDINSPGTQVVFLPGFGCLYVDVFHQSGTITITLAAESSAEEMITQHGLFNHMLSFRILLNEASVALCDDITSSCSSVELLRLTVSKLLLQLPSCDPSSCDTAAPPVHTLQVYCGRLQLDNQLYNRASFHFPVIVCAEPQMDAGESDLTLAPQHLQRFYDACFLSLTVTVSRDGRLDQLTFRIKPARVYLEDTFIYYLKTLFHTYIPECTLSEDGGRSRCVGPELSVPAEVVQFTHALVQPLQLQKLLIEPVDLLVSIHASLKLYIASDHTPLSFSLFERGPICTTPRQLVHTLAMHYAAGALFRAGWVVGSLEILGSPASLVRSIGNGVSDFFRLPYEGLTRGPGAFISGVSRGTNSFIKHISKGTLTSITNLATSLARNMDRLSLDDEHYMRQEEWRRQLPETVGDGLRQGLSRLGISLLGAIAGIVDQPMQTFTRTGEQPNSASSTARGVISGVGKGIVGVFTKPIGGAAELVSQTGYGLLHGAGLWQLPKQLHPPTDQRSADASNSHVKYIWKMLQSLGRAELHMALDVCMVSGSGQEHTGCLLLSSEVLFVVSVCEDAQQQAFPITEIQCEHDTHTPGRITLTLQQYRVTADTEADGSRERLSELQYSRLVDFVTGASQYLSPSQSSLHQQPPVTPAEPPPTVSKTYQYQADPAFARVFVCKFNMVKNKALRIGFH